MLALVVVPGTANARIGVRIAGTLVRVESKGRRLESVVVQGRRERLVEMGNVGAATRVEPTELARGSGMVPGTA